jgi:hypothetical protein
VSKLARREDAAACSERLIELMKAPTGDMFWMFPVTAIYYLGRDQLTPEAKAAVREAWRAYMPLRGDTENHWAMYYSSLYLMAQQWPDEPGERWFNGKSSKENFEESRDYLLHWMELTTTIGQGEYDCTHYIGEYAIPMLYLATWARDPAMRQRGRMMLDYIFADYAVETLNGIYVGAHARTDDTTLLEKWNGLSSLFGWLLLGNCPPTVSYGGWGIYFVAAAKNYELPEVIYRIGTDRAGTYSHYERKRTRHRWRNSDVRNAPVYKTAYITKDYAVGSDQGGLLQPIQHDGGAHPRDAVMGQQHIIHQAGQVLEVAQHGLEPLLKLSAELRAGNQRAHVEGEQALALQAFRHVAIDDAQREPLSNCRFANAGLTDQHRVVF